MSLSAYRDTSRLSLEMTSKYLIYFQKICIAECNDIIKARGFSIQKYDTILFQSRIVSYTTTINSKYLETFKLFR